MTKAKITVTVTLPSGEEFGASATVDADQLIGTVPQLRDFTLGQTAKRATVALAKHWDILRAGRDGRIITP